MKLFIVMRGVPGSGKTSFVLNFVSSQFKDNYAICSADDCPIYYDENNNYNWTQEKCSVAHSYCHKQFNDAIHRGVSFIILDNTNMQVKDFQPYVSKAKDAGYEIAYIEFPPDEAKLKDCAKRNSHNVSLEIIERMAKRWESRKL